jgi:uncharacterized alpha-E superfamily protein
MLSRTAENLYWIARYMERAETTARFLEVGGRIALLPSAGGAGNMSEWNSLLRASGTEAGFAHKYGDPVQRNVESYFFFDRDNPSSVASCITAARENARIVRTALTTQMWDALNTAFHELRDWDRMERSDMYLMQLTAMISSTSATIWNAPTARRGSSMSSITYFCHRSIMWDRGWTTTSGPRSCARFRRIAPFTGPMAAM